MEPLIEGHFFKSEGRGVYEGATSLYAEVAYDGVDSHHFDGSMCLRADQTQSDRCDTNSQSCMPFHIEVDDPSKGADFGWLIF